MTDTSNPKPAKGARIGWLAHAIWVSGFVITGVAGVYAKVSLEAAGVPTVPWARGIQLIISIALWAETPYLALLVLGRWRFRKIDPANREDVAKARAILAGSWLGVCVLMGIVLGGLFTYSGPGGFAEAVSMVLFLAPITVPSLILQAGIGAAIGGMLGLAVWSWRSGR